LRHRSGGAGFTIIELLVVVAIIIVLVGLLVVAVNAASRTAQKTSTASLMNAVSKGLERFKNDIGYYPPVLHALGAPVAPADNLRGLLNGPAQGSGTYQVDIQNWYSLTSLADYTIGWDIGENDGYGYASQQETPATGIRHPDTDGVWTATITTPADGSLAARSPMFTGKKYGPYIELDDPNLLASTDGTFDSLGNLRTFFPGDPMYNPAGPMVLCDYWGVPIRYYRRPHPPGALGQSYRSGTDIDGDGDVDGDDVVPTLSDVYLLRPWTIRPGTESVNRFGDMNPDIPGGAKTSTRNLDTAEFALWSAGPDRSHNQNITVDAVTGADDEFNKDNIVEVGP
jgi:type II secretory pathway pseudopilin PulG